MVYGCAIEVKYHASYWVQNVQGGTASSIEDKEYARKETTVSKVESGRS